MYNLILSLHSNFRWLVLISFSYMIVRSLFGWKLNKSLLKSDEFSRYITVIIFYIQIALGFFLYTISPMVTYFITNFNQSIKMRDIRFFGMEHITMMFIALIFILIGSKRYKQFEKSDEKFRVIVIWFGIGFFIILASIPWSFSPFTSRPLFR